jgi:hypothetical protein
VPPDLKGNRRFPTFRRNICWQIAAAAAESAADTGEEEKG